MLANWPPAKGPKPPEIDLKIECVVPRQRRHDFKFKQPPSAATERGLLVTTSMETFYQESVEERVGVSMDQRRRKGKRDDRLLLDHHIEAVGSLTVAQAHQLIVGCGIDSKRPARDLPIRELCVCLTYPLTVGVELIVKPLIQVVKNRRQKVLFKGETMSVGYFLWVVALEYRRIYADWKFYKIWGHGIEDLKFHSMEVKKSGIVNLVIAS